MPFADDIRKYMFPSLDRLVNRQGELVTRHPYLPTEEQLEAMDDFVEAMDLTEAGEKDEEGYASITDYIYLSYVCYLVGNVNNGSTHVSLTTQPFIGLSKHYSMVRSFKILIPIRFLLPTTN